MSGQDVLTPVRRAFLARTVREQTLLAGLAALLALTLIWFGILGPVISWRSDALRDFSRSAEGYETLLVQIEEYRALAAQITAPEDQEPLRTVADRTARERALAISRVQPLEDGRLGVWMEQADANAVLAWLEALAREQGVVVERISLDREADERVRAQLTLRRLSEAN